MGKRTYAIDVTACPGRPTGVGHYIYQLTRALIALEKRDGERFLVFGRSVQQERSELAGADFVDCGNMSVPQRLLWEQVRLPALVKDHGVTVLHSPNYTIPALARCRRVTTVHDLTCFLFPRRRKYWHAWFFRQAIRFSSRFADKVIAVSTNTADDIRRALRTPGNNIAVVPEGANPVYRRIAEDAVAAARKRLGVTGPYFLFIGTVEPTKNIERLLRAFALFRKESGTTTGMVLAGKLGWGYDGVMELIRQAGPGVIQQIGYQDDETLVALYNGACAFVYPSLYEGFGIPPLEAMSCGTPVLCSNTSSLPEVVGDAALAFDPLDERAMADAMKTVSSDETVRRRLISAGFERVKVLNWENTARQVWDIYRSLAT